MDRSVATGAVLWCMRKLGVRCLFVESPIMLGDQLALLATGKARFRGFLPEAEHPTTKRSRRRLQQFMTIHASSAYLSFNRDYDRGYYNPD